MTSTIVSEEVKGLANSVVKDIEDVVREAERAEESPLLYFTSPTPGVRYYSFQPTKTVDV